MKVNRNPAALTTLVGLGLLLGAVAAGAQVGNAPVLIPTLDTVGLATLAGAVAMAGAWLSSRRRSRK
ncbi:MAG: IPTL-CTERM sorting domain-containing protein [Acidobacteriota bacterium]